MVNWIIQLQYHSWICKVPTFAPFYSSFTSLDCAFTSLFLTLSQKSYIFLGFSPTTPIPLFSHQSPKSLSLYTWWVLSPFIVKTPPGNTYNSLKLAIARIKIFSSLVQPTAWKREGSCTASIITLDGPNGLKSCVCFLTSKVNKKILKSRSRKIQRQATNLE